MYSIAEGFELETKSESITEEVVDQPMVMPANRPSNRVDATEEELMMMQPSTSATDAVANGKLDHPIAIEIDPDNEDEEIQQISERQALLGGGSSDKAATGDSGDGDSHKSSESSTIKQQSDTSLSTSTGPTTGLSRSSQEPPVPSSSTRKYHPLVSSTSEDNESVSKSFIDSIADNQSTESSSQFGTGVVVANQKQLLGSMTT